MALRNILFDDDPILRKKSRVVEEVNDRIRQILDDMVETLHDVENGGGLAAVQVGILKRLVVIDLGETLYKLVNPEIVEAGETVEVIEGCLSTPGIYGKLQRPGTVTVKALDEWGQEITVQGDGDLAKCLCHEIDHLDGILFTDKVQEYVYY